MTQFVDRYHAAGLEGNPFAARQLGDPPLTAFVSRGLPDPPPAGSRTMVQVIGESGFGKTTHVEHWRKQTPGPYHYIPRAPYRSRWHPPPDGSIVYGDEIDRMPSGLRRRWFRRLAQAGSTVIIGTHCDLSGPARRAGLAVVSYELTRLDRETLRGIIDLRLERAAWGSTSCGLDERVRFGDEDLDRVLAESGGVPGEADTICHRLLAERLLHGSAQNV